MTTERRPIREWITDTQIECLGLSDVIKLGERCFEDELTQEEVTILIARREEIAIEPKRA